MIKVSRQPTSNVGAKPVPSVAFCTLSIGDAIAKALRGLSAKAIAAKLRRLTAVSARTVESWKQGKRTPRAQHILAMLADDTLCALVLEDVNPALARQAKIIAAEKTLQELRNQ
jgi:uncharacterized membrane protein